MARELAATDGFSLLCGRYEGVDQRVADHLLDGELSIGDYVLAGGEAAALVVIEAVARLVPGVMGNDASATEESFADGLLEYPQYTRPAEFRGWEVPEVLRSGDHGRIARWRRAQALARTLERRPDLLEAASSPTTSSAARSSRVPRTCRIADVRLDARVLEATCSPPRRTPAQELRAMNTTDLVDRANLRDDIPDFGPGDTLRCTSAWSRATASASRCSRARSSAARAAGSRETFTVRKVSFGVGVERTFPVHSPIIAKIEVVTRGDVRRAKLYYLRDRIGKAAKIKEKREPAGEGLIRARRAGNRLGRRRRSPATSTATRPEAREPEHRV